MITITSEFTKEQLQQIIETDHVQCGEASALARIALASLEAEPAIHRWRRVTVEPYGPYPWHYGNFIGFSKPVEGIEDEYYYSAPSAPGLLIKDVTTGKPLAIKLPDISSKAFWSGTGKNEKFHPETYKRWVTEAIERSCIIACVDVEVK